MPGGVDLGLRRLIRILETLDHRTTARADEQDVTIGNRAEGVDGGDQLSSSIEGSDEDRLEPARQRHR